MNPAIKLGSSGPAVQSWQQFLLSKGYSIGQSGADGYFGQQTLEATVTFQKTMGIAADGIVGEQTWNFASSQIAPLGLSQEVIRNVMASEGESTIQSGRDEYFGFREGDGTGFNQIADAVAKFGIKSQQVYDIVSQLLTQRAVRAGALNFKDPGIQAAILAVAHMRGEGGVQAILNSVAGDPIHKSATLSPKAIGVINSMTPAQFQGKFREVREDYDRKIYGGMEDSITVKGKTITGTWWDLFGAGLIARYDRERDEFLQLSS